MIGMVDYVNSVVISFLLVVFEGYWYFISLCLSVIVLLVFYLRLCCFIGDSAYCCLCYCWFWFALLGLGFLLV